MRGQARVKALLVCSILNFTPFPVSLGDGGCVAVSWAHKKICFFLFVLLVFIVIVRIYKVYIELWWKYTCRVISCDQHQQYSCLQFEWLSRNQCVESQILGCSSSGLMPTSLFLLVSIAFRTSLLCKHSSNSLPLTGGKVWFGDMKSSCIDLFNSYERCVCAIFDHLS